MTQQSNKSLFWRGAIGGVVGSVLKAAAAWIYYTLINPPKTWGYLGRNPVVLFVVIGIPLAAGVGAMVGAILDLISTSTERKLGLVARMILGGGIVGILGAILMHPVGGLSINDLSSWLIASIFYWDFGVITGAVAGAFVSSRSQRRQKESLAQTETDLLKDKAARSG